ncbi:hypothetical protein GGR50DRAFT_227279 [Xylaria sp. CBS 124048]|nr:hypothetical protein GGR50DRAFT_227279 [Xylaria sp. CBS 124048]
MPPFPAVSLLHSLIDRDTLVNTSQSALSESGSQVVCAWPVSGQYGFGTRLLYYGFVATCVLARRQEWLRNACLAATLLLPSVAAIHAVVLAAVHVDMDMDIYGAFQICSIGILAAPITVYNSKTYFNDPGRNIIFLWTGLLLAGMLSLTIEFFRITSHTCLFDDMGRSIDPNHFPYGSAACELNCVYGSPGPYSPIRRDPTNSPAVIPVPDRLSFSTVTLLAAGSSIPPVLTLIFTWEKILEINWKRRFAQEEMETDDAPIAGTNGATPKMITFINSAIMNFISSIHIPLFSGIVIVLLVLGEINFWSEQVKYQTEPFSSIGQWSNVVGTALVIPGSLFYFHTQNKVNEKEVMSSSDSHVTGPRQSMQSNTEHASISSTATGTPPRVTTEETPNGHHNPSISTQPDEIGISIERERDTSAAMPLSISNKHRNKVATLLNQFGEYLGTPAADRYDNSEFRRGQGEFPEIPGEAGRVHNLENIRSVYRHSRHRDDDGASVTPGLSKVNSYSSSIRLEESTRGRSPTPSPKINTAPTAEPRKHSPLDNDNAIPSQGVGGTTQRPRRDTLEVPTQPRPAFIRPGNHNNNDSSSSDTTPTMIIGTHGSPNIIVSAEPDELQHDLSARETQLPPAS